MSTFVDGSPPSVTPGPESDDPVDPDTGPAWLQEEIRRRMAAGRSGAGGRHARRDPAADPPGGVGHVPRHSVATPGPGAPAPGPIGGPSLPEPSAPARRTHPAVPDESWSGPAAEPATGRRIPRAYRRGARPTTGDTPATFGGPAFADGAARPPAPDEFGGPGFADARGDLDDLDDRVEVPRSTLVARGPAAGPAPGGPLPADPRPGVPTPPGAPTAAAVGPPPVTATARSEAPVRAAPSSGDGAGGLFDAGPPAPDRPSAAPARPRPAGSEVLPPRAPARLLAAPDAVAPAVPDAGLTTTAMPTTAMPVTARPAIASPPIASSPIASSPTASSPTASSPTASPPTAGLTGPPAPAPPRETPTGEPDLWTPSPGGEPPAARADPTGPPALFGDDLPDPDGGDTVLWSAHLPPVASDGTALAAPGLPVDVPAPRPPDPGEEVTEAGALRRVKVVLSERRNQAHAVRTVVDIQEGGAVGELLRSNLIGSQLTVALRFALFAGLTLGLLPLAFALFPEIGRTDVLGLRLPWLLLGVLVYPFLLGLGWWHTRTAERVEQNFADHVQD